MAAGVPPASHHENGDMRQVVIASKTNAAVYQNKTISLQSLAAGGNVMQMTTKQLEIL